MEDVALKDLAMKDLANDSQLSKSRSVTPHLSDTPDHITLGQDRHQLLQAMATLRDLGIDPKIIPIPQAVVVGDQSAGKSSIIEGITGITLPKQSGTCTRCPMYIATGPSDDPWQCRVYLRKSYYYHDYLDGSVYGHWQEGEVRSLLFSVVSDKLALEGVLQLAQKALLNPGDDYKKYRDADSIMNTRDQADFSPNIIKLDITGPGLTSLAFFDMPGVINQISDSNKSWLVDFVETLTKEYIRNGTLILLACSLENDLENSTAARFIRDLAKNDRCMCVLTKPDRYDVGGGDGDGEGEGDGVKWQSLLRVLRGQAFVQGYGYFVARQPSQKDLNRGITYEQARQVEREFFAKRPWSTAGSHQFGTQNLTHALSEMMASQIRDSLPGIAQQLAAQLQAIDTELQEYPDPPKNAYGRVNDILNGLVFEFRHVVGGTPPNNLLHRISLASRAFRDALKNLRPSIPGLTEVNVPVTPQKRGYEVLDLSSGDETPLSRKSAKTTLKAGSKPSSQSSSGNDALRTSQGRQADRAPQGRAPRSRSTTVKVTTPYRLEDISGYLERMSSSSSIPNQVDHRAVDQLRSQYIGDWSGPLNTYIYEIQALLQDQLLDLVTSKCSHCKGTPLFQKLENLVKVILEQAMAEQRKQANRALHRERAKPFTLDKEGHEHEIARELEALSTMRFEARANEYLDDTESEIKATTGDDRKRKIMSEHKKLAVDMPPDRFKREIEVVAKLFGYYALASKRFLDVVAQSIQNELLPECSDNIGKQLRAGLALPVEAVDDVEEHCAALLAEDPEREVRRGELKKKRANLLEAQALLDSLPRSSAA